MNNASNSSFNKKTYDSLPKKQAKSYEIDLGQNVKNLLYLNFET